MGRPRLSRRQRAGCYYEPCGGEVYPAQGRFYGYGRCRRCAAVVKRSGRKWRKLTEAEWKLAPRGLTDIRPWLEVGY